MSNDRDKLGQGPSSGHEADRSGEGASEDLADRIRTDPMARARYVRWKARKAERAAANPSAPVPQTTGASLGSDVRARMEPQLGASLSSVKIHTGGESAHAASELGARAFTTGQDIHFGAGEYAPGTKEGDRLIAHELTHTVQAQKSGIQRKADLEQTGGEAEHGKGDQEGHEVSHPDEPAEKEADAVADKAADNLHAGGASSSKPAAPDASAEKAPAVAAKLRPGTIARSSKGSGGGGSTPQQKAEEILQRNKHSISKSMDELNKLGLSQKDMVQVLTSAYKASGRDIGGTQTEKDGSIVLLSRRAGPNQPVNIVSPTGAYSFGTADIEIDMKDMKNPIKAKNVKKN